MLDTDPPEHTHNRGLVIHGFTPRSVAGLEPRVGQTVDDLLEDLERLERVDLIRSLVYPLPITVNAELMGVPPEDREQFEQWSRVVDQTVDQWLDSAGAQSRRETV